MPVDVDLDGARQRGERLRRRGRRTAARDSAAVKRPPRRRPSGADERGAERRAPPSSAPERWRNSRRSVGVGASAAVVDSDAADQPQRADPGGGAEHARQHDVPRRAGPPARRRPRADDPEQADADDADDEAVAQGDDADDPGVDGEHDADADQQRRLVVRAERVDGELLDERRRGVDDAVADVEHRRAPGAVEAGDELGDGEGDGGGRRGRRARRTDADGFTPTFAAAPPADGQVASAAAARPARWRRGARSGSSPPSRRSVGAIVSPRSYRSTTRGSTYEPLATVGVLPRYSATSTIAPRMARAAPRRRRRHVGRAGEGDRGQHGAVPRAEVLRRDFAADDVLDVLVDVVRRDVPPAAPVAVGEQLGAAAAAPAQRRRRRRGRRRRRRRRGAPGADFAGYSKTTSSPSTRTCRFWIVARPKLPLSSA